MRAGILIVLLSPAPDPGMLARGLDDRADQRGQRAKRLARMHAGMLVAWLKPDPAMLACRPDNRADQRSRRAKRLACMRLASKV